MVCGAHVAITAPGVRGARTAESPVGLGGTSSGSTPGSRFIQPSLASAMVAIAARTSAGSVGRNSILLTGRAMSSVYSPPDGLTQLLELLSWDHFLGSTARAISRVRIPLQEDCR